MGNAAMAAADASGPTDAEVVQRAREGDHDAFRVLVERYQGRAYGLALRVLRDEDDARDAVQDAFLKAYGALDRFQGRASFYTWLYRIVMNQCLDRKRRDKSDREVEWNDEAASTQLPAVGALAGGGAPVAQDEVVERGELRAAIAEAIAELPEDARRTIELREIDGLTYREISEALGIPKGTVMSRLHYARRKLQEALASTGAEALLDGGAEGTT
ncbi:MAG: sigma-70 family RNA polymerase sigma factor [Deltaproteobacteria bacterium]|nr:sigma-70 family RNA polymerase sigma factor [Deltaproteobacteria bacterium]MBW2359764.1 sigma-70 family RNA polymerase sigma factor [Deltaproteobacteria bacterium]